MRHLANLLTLSRVFIAIFFYVYVSIIRITSRTDMWVLLLCFVLIEASDLFDGMVARNLTQVTDLGKLLDPLCDVTAHFLCIYALSLVQLAPPIVVAIFVIREVWIQMLRMQMLKKNIVFAAQWSGKIKTWCFGIAILGSLLIVPYGFFSSYTLWLRPVVFGLYYFAALMSVFSGLQYLFVALSHTTKKVEPKE